MLCDINEEGIVFNTCQIVIYFLNVGINLHLLQCTYLLAQKKHCAGKTFVSRAFTIQLLKCIRTNNKLRKFNDDWNATKYNRNLIGLEFATPFSSGVNLICTVYPLPNRTKTPRGTLKNLKRINSARDEVRATPIADVERKQSSISKCRWGGAVARTVPDHPRLISLTMKIVWSPIRKINRRHVVVHPRQMLPKTNMPSLSIFGRRSEDGEYPL